MAAASIINIKNCSVIFAATEAGLTAPTPVDYKCQVNSAEIQAQPKLQTVPATFCNPESQMPSATGWQLVITFLQDWGATNSLSQFLFDNDAELMWFKLAPIDMTLDDVPEATGQCWVVAGQYLGAAGAPVNATSTMPVPAKPTIAAAGTFSVEGASVEGETFEVEDDAELATA